MRAVLVAVAWADMLICYAGRALIDTVPLILTTALLIWAARRT